MYLRTTIANRTASVAALTTFILIAACPALCLAAPPTAIFAGTSGGLLKSTNGGATWTNISPAGGFTGTQVTAVAIDPVHIQTIYVAASANLYKTTDGGTHWTEIDNGLPSGPLSNFGAIVIDPTNPSIVYAGSGETLAGSIYKSTNGGASWTNVGGGVPLTAGSVLSLGGLAIDPTHPKTLYLGGYDGTPMAKTTDGGATWAHIANGFVQTIAVNPASPSTVYFSGPFGISMTTDGGSTFTSFLGPGQVGQILIVNGLAIDPSNPATVYAGAGDTIYKSTATPPSFAVFGSGLGSSAVTIRALTVDPANPLTVYAATNKGVYVSTDGATSWSGPVTPAADLAALALAMEPNATQGAVFQEIENAVTQLIGDVGTSPSGVLSCFLLQALENEIPLLENWGLLSSAQGQALQAQIQPVVSTAPCK